MSVAACREAARSSRRAATRAIVVAAGAILCTAPSLATGAASGPSAAPPQPPNRLTLRVFPTRFRAGHPITVVLGDPSGRGTSATVCVNSRHSLVCRAAVIRPGVRTAAVSFRPRFPGAATLVVSERGRQRRSKVLRIAGGSGRLTLVNAGDSEAEQLQSSLLEIFPQLGVHTIDDGHASTALSSSFTLDWPQHARTVTTIARPDVTLMFIGLNDDFSMKTPVGASVDCCGDPWIAELARRARELMRTFAAGGAGRVYWMLLPPPKPAWLAARAVSVNEAWERAARSLSTVTLIDLRPLFPEGTERADDGYHLTAPQNQRIARLIRAQMQRDGVL